MAKQVIVVVHGVGVKQAGVSSDLLAAALQDDDGKNVKTRLPPHSSDDFVLLESPRYDSSGKASTFPARVRRYRSYDEKGKVKDERVIADFFWGDVTAFGSSVVSLVLAYFKVAMGLSHAIRENARNIYPYPNDNWEDYLIPRLARGAALTIHGPIIALNVVLILGLLLAALLQMGADMLAPDTPAATAVLRVQIAAVGLTAILGGLFLLRLGRGAFLYRHLLTWVVLSGAIFLVLGSPELLGFADSDAVASIASWLVGLEPGMHPDDFNRTYPGLLAIGWRMVALMSASWLVVFVQLALICGLRLVRQLRVGPPRAPSLIIPAVGLMSLLWFLLTAALWAGVLKLPASYNLGLKQEAVAAALVAIGAAVLVLLLLILAAVWVLIRKSELKRGEFAKRPESYMDGDGASADGHANRYRLLIASWMLYALSIFLPLVFATFALVFIPSTGEFAWVAGIRQLLENWTITIIFGILAVGSALVYSLSAEFSAGIGILADVLAYLNNSSWMPGDTADDRYRTDEPPNRTWLERLITKENAGPATNARPRGYWLRRRIHDRLDVLVRTLIRDEKPDRLDIVSHSQGTMIAIDLIELRGKEWLNELPAGSPRDMRLVTMGSPYTHLYDRYFPVSFPSVADRANLKSPNEGGLLKAWLNIFRIDDFVGTHIGKGFWPTEFPVRPNGHTNYWVDRLVVDRLREFLGSSEDRKSTGS